MPERGDDISEHIAFLEHLIHRVEPAAQVTITPYVWNDRDLLDVAVAIQGHERHYEISAARCGSMFKVPEILRHDFEALITDLKREIRQARPGA